MKHAYLLLVGVTFALAGAAKAADRPVVVELFTSQGCSSCPPAEAFLVDLVSQRRDVLALAFHVDYWDRLGWKDSFSSAAATQRQQLYSRLLGTNQVYTPQIVVDGRSEAIGSDRAAVLRAVNAAAARTMPTIPMRLVRDGNAVTVTIGAGAGKGRALLVGFDPRQETAVRRGENAGRTILQANVVRSVQPVADWQGREITLSKEAPAGQRTALILQASDGRVLGATVLDR